MRRVAARTTLLTAGLVVADLTAGPALAPATATKPTSLTVKATKSTVASKDKDTPTGTLKSGTMVLAGKPSSLRSAPTAARASRL